jgi:hypothetical protein
MSRRTNRERILDYLWSIAPDWATNSQIREATGIGSHQQVYLFTQELMHSGRIRGLPAFELLESAISEEQTR